MKDKKIKELLDLLDTHDCHLTAEDGCQCISIAEDLQKLGVRVDHETAYPVNEPF